jgi:NAD(P)-dependent dehydrogenase (short-subunit alcohol dehydrogenase family)
MPARNATCAIVGAGDFIGSAIARKFAAEGYTVFVGRRTAEKLEPLRPLAASAKRARSMRARKMKSRRSCKQRTRTRRLKS